MRAASFLIPGLIAALACGCTSPGDTGGDDDDSTADPDGGGGGGPDGSDEPGADFTTLITASWTTVAGTEPYWCARRTLTEDTYITSFRDLAPLGTHHTALTIVRNPTQPDREYECSPQELETQMVYAAGVGTDDFTFPEGVAIKLPAGSQLLLNLHLFNTTNGPLSGTSGALIKSVPASEVVQEAEMVLAGTTAFSVPPTGEVYPATGRCTFNQAATLLNIWPHMHQIGTHMKVTHNGEVLHDQPFAFTEQRNWVLEPGHPVAAGDHIDVECRWINNGEEDVPYGDSSTREMCFAGFYRYPSTAAPLFCIF